MAGHVRSGRRFLPQVAATGLFELADWVRDDLPDLLWPAALFAHRGTDAAQGFVAWQKAVQEDLRDHLEPGELADSLDGRLTGLERLAQRCTEAKSSVLKHAAEQDLLPGPVARLLTTYPDRPATWLVESDLRPPEQSDIDLLMKAVVEAISDGHREAVIKCLQIWSAEQAGTFSTDAWTIELLKPYPTDPTTRSQADSVIRASWMAAKGAILYKDGTRYDHSVAWARIFWGVNSMTTRCLRRRDVDPGAGDASVAGDADSIGTHDESLGTGEVPIDGDHLQRLAKDLVSSYVEALDTAPSRLYDNERQEVLAGLVSRAGREVITALGYPDLWCSEHGSHVNRVLVEVRVLIQWMATQDPMIYRRYQDYGSGKAKLYAQILEELPDGARPTGFDDGLGELRKVSHNDGVLDHRVVDTSDSFAGKSLRAMADECGLLDLYRRAYYMASGIAHSEWWAVELHAMERCLNVLHRGHLIPSLSLSAGGSAQLAQAWVDQLYALIRVSLSILGTDENAVEAAFAWLEGDVEGGS